MAGANIGLVVAEPTLPGIHNLERVLLLLRHFSIPAFVCVNMYDINLNNTERIERLCEENNVEVIGRIPFDLKVTEAVVNGKTIIEHSPESGVAEEIKRIWKRILSVQISILRT
ncbi:MAG: hypothetical protein QXX99_00035 [Candidatus Bathyarchaeia archaeon]